MSSKKGLDTKTDGLNGRQSCKPSTSPSKGSNEHDQRKKGQETSWTSRVKASYLRVPKWNLGPETGYTKVFSGFLQPHRANSRTEP
jgi:hypothetical protein